MWAQLKLTALVAAALGAEVEVPQPAGLAQPLPQVPRTQVPQLRNRLVQYSAIADLPEE